MNKYIRSSAAILLPVTLAIFAGCSTEKKNDTLAQDSSLNKDVQLANRDTAVQPQLSDVPAPTTTSRTTTTTTTTRPAPAPARTTPRPAAPRPTTVAPAPAPTTTTTASGNTVARTPAGSERALGSIGSGTTVSLTSNSRVCTNTNKVGDHVTATVANAVSGTNGAVIPAGATATLEVTTLKRSENANDKIDMGFRLLAINFGGHSYPASGTFNSVQVDRVRNESRGKDAQKVATGAAIGAVVGQILGKNTKSTVIGGAVGAAAGAGAAVGTANYEGCVPSGGTMSVTLDNAIQVHV